MNGSVYRYENGVAYLAIQQDGSPSKKGDLFTRVMSPTNATMTGSEGATQIISDATGFKAFLVKALDSLAAGERVIVGWSYTVNDGAAVAALVNAKATELGTATGIDQQNVRVFTNTGETPNELRQALQDGLIARTIAVRTVSAGLSNGIEFEGVQ